MKNMRWLVIFGLLAMVLAPMSALADMETTVHGEARFRAENVENYFDFNDNEGDDSFSFFPFRVRLGVGTSFGDKVYGYFSIQEGDVFGQDEAVQGEDGFFPTGAGGNLNETDQDDGELVVYQAYVKMNEVGGTSLSLKFGRQEYVQGNEFLFGDLDFYNGISHDGVRARWDLDLGPLDVVWFRTEEAFTPDDDDTDDDTDFIGANWLLTDIVPDGDLEFYVYYTDSHAHLSGDNFHLEYFTVGARAGQSKTDESGFIWSAEIAVQSGDADCEQFFCFELGGGVGGESGDVSTYGAEGMFGYNMAADSGNHQFFVNVYVSSGDKDEEDTDLEDFIAPFQDIHSRNGAADVMDNHNLTSISIGWDWQGEQHGLHAEIFQFTATEDGAGSSEDAFSGVGSDDSGLPGDFGFIFLDGEDDLGTEIDIIYTYLVNEYFGFEAGVAVFQPGDAITKFANDVGDPFKDDDITRVWGQARLRW